MSDKGKYNVCLLSLCCLWFWAARLTLWPLSKCCLSFSLEVFTCLQMYLFSNSTLLELRVSPSQSSDVKCSLYPVKTSPRLSPWQKTLSLFWCRALSPDIVSDSVESDLKSSLAKLFSVVSLAHGENQWQQDRQTHYFHPTQIWVIKLQSLLLSVTTQLLSSWD